MKAELSRRRGHAEAAVCEGLLMPDDSAGIDSTHNMGAATAPPLPDFGRAAAYQEYVATGSWARLVFETHGVDERIDSSCSNPPRVQAG